VPGTIQKQTVAWTAVTVHTVTSVAPAMCNVRTCAYMIQLVHCSCLKVWSSIWFVCRTPIVAAFRVSCGPRNGVTVTLQKGPQDGRARRLHLPRAAAATATAASTATATATAHRTDAIVGQCRRRSPAPSPSPGPTNTRRDITGPDNVTCRLSSYRHLSAASNRASTAKTPPDRGIRSITQQ
jgi:hypothetical protein